MLWINSKTGNKDLQKQPFAAVLQNSLKKKQLKIHLNLQEICSKFANFLQIHSKFTGLSPAIWLQKRKCDVVAFS